MPNFISKNSSVIQVESSHAYKGNAFTECTVSHSIHQLRFQTHNSHELQQRKQWKQWKSQNQMPTETVFTLHNFRQQQSHEESS